MKTRISRGRVGDAPNPVDVHVGAQVRKYRALRGMSQEKFAEVLGVTFQQIQKYESGRNRISASRLWDISQVLNTPISLFYEDMTNEITSLSPRHVKTADTDTLSPTLAQMTQLYNDDPIARRETLTLVRSYYKIPNRAIAHKILELLRMEANFEDDFDEEEDIPQKKSRKK